jgi:hypothetical protein
MPWEEKIHTTTMPKNLFSTRKNPQQTWIGRKTNITPKIIHTRAKYIHPYLNSPVAHTSRAKKATGGAGNRQG